MSLRARKGTVHSPRYIVRNAEYGEFTYGAPVKVSGERGRWEFRHHCVNTDTGSEWVDVFGGVPGTETLRAFKPDRVSLVRPKGYRRPRRTATEVLLEELI